MIVIKRRMLASFMAIALISGAMSGCGGTDKANSSELGNRNAKYAVSDKLKDLSIYLITGNTGAYDNEWPVFKKAQELTNVRLTGTLSRSNSEAKQSYNLMMASGELADIVAAGKTEIETYIQQGVFLPLGDLIEQHAPNIKKFMDENPQIKKGAASNDGKIYLVPFVADGVAAAGWYIRKDWLNQLKLNTPKNIDEFYNVLKAFKTGDPNKNNIPDEVPYFNRDKLVNDLFPLFGLKTDWYVGQDSKVHYPKYEQQYKSAVTNVAKWYSEGLIDKEIFSRANNARDFMLRENLGGVTHDWFASTSGYNNLLKDKIADFDFSPIAPPADVFGKVWENSARSTGVSSGWAISKTNPDPVATIKYFDFWFTEEGRRLYNFGIEDEQYTVVDGKPKFKPEILKGDKPVLSQLWAIGAQTPIGAQQDFYYEEQLMSRETLDGIKMYVDNQYISPTFPILPFSVEQREAINDKMTIINTYIAETEQQWIMGAKPIDSTFDKFIADLKNFGMEDVITIYNDAYQQYINY